MLDDFLPFYSALDILGNTMKEKPSSYDQKSCVHESVEASK